MLRLFILCLLSVPLVVQAQWDRLEIEIVPVYVNDVIPMTPEEELAIILKKVAQIPEILGMVHRALAMVNVGHGQYDLSVSFEFHDLRCTKATVLVEQICTHETAGPIRDLKDFLAQLYPPGPHELGVVQLHVLLLPEQWYWKGYVGQTWMYRYTNPNYRHWSTTSCKLWAIAEIEPIAHELGHCFQLVHNEDDSDTGIDLMLAAPGYNDWLKESNIKIVAQHFRIPPPEVPRSGTMPMVELQIQH